MNAPPKRPNEPPAKWKLARSKPFQATNQNLPQKRPIIRAQRTFIPGRRNVVNSTGRVQSSHIIYKGNLAGRRAYVGEFVGTHAPTFKGSRMNSLRPKDVQTKLDELNEQEFRSEKQKREKIKRTKFEKRGELFKFEFQEGQERAGKKRGYMGRKRSDTNFEYAILEFKPGTNPVIYPAEYIQFRVKDAVIGKDIASAEEAERRHKLEQREHEKQKKARVKKMRAFEMLQMMFEGGLREKTEEEKKVEAEIGEFKSNSERLAASVASEWNVEERHQDSKRLKRERLRGECEEIVDYRFSASDDEDEAPPDDRDRIHDSESDHVSDDESEDDLRFQKLDKLQKKDVEKDDESDSGEDDGWGGAGNISDVSDEDESGMKRSLPGQGSGSNKRRRLEKNTRTSTEEQIEEEYVKSVLMRHPNGISTTELLSSVKLAYGGIPPDKFKRQLSDVLRSIATLRAKRFYLKQSNGGGS